MEVEISFPDELLVAIKEDRDTFKKMALVYILGKLYQSGKISGGLGASVLDCSRWEFYRILSEHGFPVMDYPDEELEQEATSSRDLAERVTRQ